MNTSKYIQNLEDVYCHSRSAVTSELGLSRSSASLPTRIINGGKKILYTAAMTGILLNNTIPSYADDTVSAGETIYGVMVGSDPAINDVVSRLNNYGTTFFTVIQDGGYEHVWEGGLSVSALIRDGGKQIISNAGSANMIRILSGGSQIVSSGGQITNVYIYEGGTQIISQGATGNNIHLYGGSQVLSGVANGIQIHSGEQTVSGAQARAYFTTIENGGTQNVWTGAQTISGIVGNGGSQSIHGGGSAINTVISSGGTQSILGVGASSAVATSTTISSGGTQIISGVSAVANNTSILSGGTQEVQSKGIAFATEISSGGLQVVSNRGLANAANVYGEQRFLAGASGGMGNVIYSGGVQNISGGIVSTTRISANGTQNIYDGALADYTTIFNGGTQNVSSGGSAHFTSIYNGGIQNILDGGQATTTIIISGTQNILSGGTANTVINQGTVNLSTGGVLNNYSGIGNLYVYGDNNLSGTIDIGGGKMVFGNNTSATVSVENLSANGAVVSMGVNLENLTADQLQITSSFDGNVTVSLRNTADMANIASGDDIKLIDISNTATVTGTFSLLGGQWDEGGYIYKLLQDDGDPDYYLRTTGDLTDTIKTMANIPMLNAVVAKIGMNSLNKRMGDLRDMNNPANKQGVWVRTYYKDATVDDLLKTDMSLFGVEAGYDWLFNADDPTKLYAGVMVGYMKADSIKTKTSTGDSNNGKGDAPSVGIYATLANENGWFIDLAARNFWSKIENTTHTSSGSTLKFDAKRDLITGSLEVGKSFTADNGFKVEPKVEVSYMNTGKETTPVTGGTGNLEYDAENYLTGKAAIMFAYKKEMANKMLIEPLVELAYNHEFNGKGKVRYGGAETETSLKGGSFEAAAGLSMQLADNLYWHAIGTYEKGNKLSGWGLNAGIRLGFGGNDSEKKKNYKNKNKYQSNSYRYYKTSR